MQQAHGQAGACQLGDVIDDEIRVGGGSGHVIPILGNGILRQVEVDGRDGSNGVHAHALGMGCQLHAVGGIVAAHMGNDGDLPFGLAHDSFQQLLALIGGAAHIDALDALGDQVAGQGFRALRGNIALCIIAGIERGDDAAVFG